MHTLTCTIVFKELSTAILKKQTHLHTYVHINTYFCLTPHGCECMCVYCFCVCVWLGLLVCVSSYMYVRTSLCLCVGFFRGGFLAVEWPCAVCVRAGSQHSLLQEEVSGVCQVCGAALPPGRKRLLFTHSTATFATVEQLAHRFLWLFIFLKY